MNKFKLFKIDQDTFVCKDDNIGIACTFERGLFNKTQRFTMEGITPADPDILARSMREMNDWLQSNYYDVVMPINHRQRIGNKIKMLRLNKGLKQSELSDKIGIHQSNITRIEAGRYSVGLDILQEIANALDCDLDIVSRNENDE